MTLLETFSLIFRKIKDLGKKICCLDDRVEALENTPAPQGSRFGVAGEDETANEERFFYLNEQTFMLSGNQTPFSGGYFYIATDPSTGIGMLVQTGTINDQASMFSFQAGSAQFLVQDNNSGDATALTVTPTTVVVNQNLQVTDVGGGIVSVEKRQNLTSGSHNFAVFNDSNKLFHNLGATGLVTINLPNASPDAGVLKVMVLDTNGITIQAPVGHTIRVGTAVSSAGGTITSTTIGHTVTLVNITATSWVALSHIGTWTTT